MRFSARERQSCITCKYIFYYLFPTFPGFCTWWIICFWPFPGISCAQISLSPVPPSYTVKHFTDENGLPQNSVKGIAQGSDGFIWLTTENGLVRFDGRDFYIFDKSNVRIESSRVSTFRRSFNHQEDKLYAQVSNDTSFIIQHGKVGVGKNRDTERLSILFSEKDQRKVYVTSGLPSYYADTFSPETYIIPHSDGDFFACSKNKVEYFHNWKRTRYQKVKSASPWDLFKLGDLLFSSLADGSFTRVGNINKPGDAISGLFPEGDIVLNPAYNKRKREFKIFWNVMSGDVFLYLNKSLYLVQDTGHGLDTRLILSGFDFEANYIATIHYDKKFKRLFLGSATKGLFVASHNDFRTLTVNKNPQDNIFYAQIPFSDSTVLVMMNRVLGMTNRGRGVFSYILNKEVENHAVANNSLLKDREGNIWLKSFARIVKYDSTGKKKRAQWAFPGEWITRLHEGLDGQIWIGTNDAGLHYINRGETEVHSMLKKTIRLVTYLHQETADLLWVGTEKGLYRIQLSTQKAEKIKGLEDTHIRSLYFSSPGQIWVTSQDRGFYLYNQGVLIQFPVDRNKYLMASHSIFEDKNGFFWITTNKGLFQVSKNDLLQYANNRIGKKIYYLYYDKSKGFNTNEFNGGCQPCVVRLGNGYVSLPSLEGLVWFKPEKVIPEVPDAKMKLDRVEVGNKVIPIHTGVVQLPLKALQVKMYFAIPYFGHSDNLKLAYSLGEDGSSEPVRWFPLNNKEMIVHLSNLDPGQHTLMVRKANGFGLNNYDYTKVKIEVPYPWYDSWWTRLFVILYLLAWVYRYFRRRVRSIETKNARLEGMIAERTQKLEQAMAVMKQSQEEVTYQMYIQSRIIASITHDFRTPMNSIIYASSKIENMIDISRYAQIREVSASIKETSIGIKVLLDNLLEYIRPMVHNRRVQREIVILSELVSLKFGLLQIAKRAHPNVFINEVPIGITVSANYDLLGIIVHNLIDNANKFTYKGVVKVSVQDTEHSLHLIIEDTGIGIPSDVLSWLNSGTRNDLQNDVQTEKRGIGLIIVKELINLLRLKLKVESDHYGSRFSLIFEKDIDMS